MLRITRTLWIDPREITFSFVRSPGPGGQNVNKLATTAVLRFNLRTSASLTDIVRERLRLVLANRLTSDGEIIIKASRFRTQERNRQDALERFTDLLRHAAMPPKLRKKTKPSKTSVQKRLNQKTKKGKQKVLRGRVREE